MTNNDIKSKNFSNIIENITEKDGEGSTIDACREQLPKRISRKNVAI